MSRIEPRESPVQRVKTFRDPAYLKSAKGRSCDVCGSVGTTVFAHMRVGNEGGMGLKPSDRLGAFLCSACHAFQEAHPGYEWWGEYLLKTWMINRHDQWEPS